MAELVQIAEPKSVKEFQNRIEQHKEVLLSCMEYQFGLKDKLYSSILSKLEYQQLEAIHCKFEQNERLLKIIATRQEVKDYTAFMDALPDYFQSHLKAVIYKDNKFTKDDSDKPLTEEQLNNLKGKRSALVDILSKEVPKLLDDMISCNCISKYHSSFVSETTSLSHEKARKLLDIVENRSLIHFQLFNGCLKASKSQAYNLTRFLNSGEDETKEDIKGVSEFKAETSIDGTDGKSKLELEEAVSSRCTDSEVKSFKAKCGKWFFDCLVAIFTSNSIKVYFSYSSLNVLDELRKASESEEMRNSIQALCDFLLMDLVSAGTLKIGRISMVDYSSQTFLQKCIDGKADPSDHMSNHPLLRNGEKNMKEVFTHTAYKKARRKLLVFSFMWRIENGRKLSSRPDLEAFETLAHVCHDWCETSLDKEFKQTVKTLRKQSRKKNRSLKLRCEIMIPMPNATCATSIYDDIYLTTEFEVNTMYLLKQVPQVQQESGKPRRIPLQQIDLDELERIQIADNLDVLGMEAAEDGNGIFCINRPDGSIWFWTRSEARNPATVLQQFSASSCVTVCPEDGLRIVVLRDSNVLEMHNQPSELIQVMHLPDYITKPNAVACNNDGDVIVSYGSDEDELHRISMVDRRGRVVLTYGDRKGSGPNQLNNPSSVTLDHDEDILYVVDKDNGRILALDKNLELINVVLDSKYDDLRNITSVHYAKVTKQLVVVHQDMVNLYKIHRPGVQEVAK